MPLVCSSSVDKLEQCLACPWCREVCTAAGLDVGQARTLQLCRQLLEGVKEDGRISLDDFLQIAYFKGADKLLASFGLAGTGDED